MANWVVVDLLGALWVASGYSENPRWAELYIDVCAAICRCVALSL